MIIYQDTKAGFVADIANNHFGARIESAFLRRTGSVPADGRGWANDYARFSTVLASSNVADDITVAIEYHCSPVGRSRIDVLLAGSDGQNDNGLIIELKAWDTAEASPVSDMVSPFLTACGRDTSSPMARSSPPSAAARSSSIRAYRRGNIRG